MDPKCWRWWCTIVDSQCISVFIAHANDCPNLETDVEIVADFPIQIIHSCSLVDKDTIDIVIDEVAWGRKAMVIECTSLNNLTVFNEVVFHVQYILGIDCASKDCS